MIPKECKRLIEVDFPIATVSRHAAREKKIFGHHPQMLNQWWARRPLASCRAVLMGLLLPDPADKHCPSDFPEAAWKILHPLGENTYPGPEKLRKALLDFIGDFAAWERSTDAEYLKKARALVKLAHGEEPPLVVDPFAGGGSIPLEALRLGCDAFASDLNPVACLILKVMLEDIPRYGPGLADELRKVGAQIKEAAEKELGEFYPVDSDGARPIAYLWARTVRCEAPDCGAEIPLMRSFWLCKKANRKRALRYRVERPASAKAEAEPPRIEFEIFEPEKDKEVPAGTVTRAKATCLACGAVLPPVRVRAQLSAQRGGADAIFDEQGRRTGGARLLAVVRLKEGERGRFYRLSAPKDYEAVRAAMGRLEEVAKQKLPNGLSPVPDEPLPPIGTLGFRVQRYGMWEWGDLFTARQKVTLVTLLKTLPGPRPEIRECLSFVVTRLADKNASLVSWDSGRETIGHVFNRQALPIVWDFVESALPQGADHVLGSAVGILIGVVAGLSSYGSAGGQVEPADATNHPLPDETAHVWFTDPPYYDAVPYADLSDFFLVWLKRTLPDYPLLRDPFDPDNPLSPKTREVVQDETKECDGRVKDRGFFEDIMGEAFAEGRRVLQENGVGSVIFAHKTTEGWEALLSGMIRGGWTITGSWPIATEMASRLRARESAALATSIHLICRPRPADAPVGDWAEVLRELPRRVGDWMERLQGEGVRGADLVFACIGPALEIYSRYSRVEDAEGREIPLGGDAEATAAHRRGYLSFVWEVVGRTALEQILGTEEARARNSAVGALEEDARLTALFLWTLQGTRAADDEAKKARGRKAAGGDEPELDEGKGKSGGFTLIFDVVRRFAQPLGIHLEEWEGRMIETRKGVVRLLPVKERAKQLFGSDDVEALRERFEALAGGPVQLTIFPEEGAVEIRGRGKRRRAVPGKEMLRTRREATTLDRVHAAMLFQAGGQANALRSLLEGETHKGPDFLRLANALSALYPRGSEEKRLLDAMLLAVPR